MFSEKLKELRAKKGITQGELSDAVGVSPGNVGDWERGRNKPGYTALAALAQFFEVTSDYLLELEHENPSRKNLHFQLYCDGVPLTETEVDLIAMYRLIEAGDRKTIFDIVKMKYEQLTGEKISTYATYTGENQLAPAKITPFPSVDTLPKLRNIAVYDLPASAGTGLFLDSDDYTLMDFLIDAVPLQASFGVRISGDSMAPRYNDGDIVFLKQRPTLDDGQIGVFILNREAYCKKYVEKDGKPFLESINPNYPPIRISKDDDIRVVGKVIGSIKP